MKSSPDDGGTVSTGDDRRVLWICPGCKCPETHAPIRGPLNLIFPCRFQPGKCWCEEAEPATEYCSLCVRYYKNKSAEKMKCTKRTSKQEASRKKASLKRKISESFTGGVPQLESPGAFPLVCAVEIGDPPAKASKVFEEI